MHESFEGAEVTGLKLEPATLCERTGEVAESVDGLHEEPFAFVEGEVVDDERVAVGLGGAVRQREHRLAGLARRHQTKVVAVSEGDLEARLGAVRVHLHLLVDTANLTDEQRRLAEEVVLRAEADRHRARLASAEREAAGRREELLFDVEALIAADQLVALDLDRRATDVLKLRLDAGVRRRLDRHAAEVDRVRRHRQAAGQLGHDQVHAALAVRVVAEVGLLRVRVENERAVDRGRTKRVVHDVDRHEVAGGDPRAGLKP